MVDTYPPIGKTPSLRHLIPSPAAQPGRGDPSGPVAKPPSPVGTAAWPYSPVPTAPPPGSAPALRSGGSTLKGKGPAHEVLKTPHPSQAGARDHVPDSGATPPLNFAARRRHSDRYWPKGSKHPAPEAARPAPVAPVQHAHQKRRPAPAPIGEYTSAFACSSALYPNPRIPLRP